MRERDKVYSIKIIEKEEYKDILIVFSARKTEKGKFTFYKQVIDFPASIIFVNDYSTEWYLNGTPEFKSSLDLVNYLLGKIYNLKKEGTQIYTLGSSMGAYAALMYGSLLQVDKILAFGPESELCVPLGRSIESLANKYKEGEKDISKLYYKTPSNVLIISGNNDIPDLYCSSKFREGNKYINIKLINNYTHVVAKYIHEKIPLSEFINLYFLSSVDKVFEKFEFGNILSVEEAIAIKKFNENLVINKNITLNDKKLILNIAKNNPYWSMPQYYVGLIFYKEKDYISAIKYLKKALDVQPNLGRARLKLSQIYIMNKELENALSEALTLKKYNFTYSVGVLLSQIYKEQNNMMEYKNILTEIFEALKLNKNQYNEISKKLNSIENL